VLPVVYSPRYEVKLPGHIWPTDKYRLIAERLTSDVAWREPREASWDDLALVHTSEYLAKIREDRLTANEIATLELPWHPAIAGLPRIWVADSTTRSPTTARGSARSTTLRLRYACCSAIAASVAPQ
jgi:acetoin utilization deacetylase AcuC-like enzyme